MTVRIVDDAICEAIGATYDHFLLPLLQDQSETLFEFNPLAILLVIAAHFWISQQKSVSLQTPLADLTPLPGPLTFSRILLDIHFYRALALCARHCAVRRPDPAVLDIVFAPYFSAVSLMLAPSSPSQYFAASPIEPGFARFVVALPHSQSLLALFRHSASALARCVMQAIDASTFVWVLLALHLNCIFSHSELMRCLCSGAWR